MNTSTKRGSKFPRRLLLSLLFSTILLSLLTWLAYAEGSGSLYPASINPDAHRANLEWRNSFYGDNFLRRRTLLQLYLEPDEVALMGSSAVGVDAGDILVYRSDQVTGDIGDEQFNGTPVFTCSGQRNQPQFQGSLTMGQITSRDQELAGPATIDPATGLPDPAGQSGYVPCFFRPQDAGIGGSDIYRIVFYGPAGGDSNAQILPTGQIDLANGENFNNQQATSVAAWDVTVRDDFASTDDINGRLFANYLALFTGGNPQPMFSPLYILTTDGFIYKIDMRGLDPFGFIVYANDVGFLDNDGQTPLYHDVVADRTLQTQERNQLNALEGNTLLSDPTHLIFFNEPARETIEAVNFPTDPIYPEISAVTFLGDLSGNSTFVGAGGTFTFNSTLRTGIYEIIISRDGSNFDPSVQQNRVLRGRFSNGLPGDEITVPWDGRANNGDAFPAGTYQARFSVHAGEYHFPLLDVENSQGGPQYELINPPNGECPFDIGPPDCFFVAFFDDRGYITADGTPVDDPGQALTEGADPPNPPFSNLLSGFDTRNDNRAFGDGSQSGFGDKKGLDLWTYFPSEALLTPLNIFGPDLAIQKTDHDISTAPGGVITYTLAYTNISTFPITATGVVITETVPANTIFNAGASTAGWSCVDGSPAGTPCVFSVGELPANDSGAVIFAVTVDDPLDPAVIEILNGAIISDDRSQGDDPTPQNNTTEERTPVNHPLSGPDLQISKTDGGITSGPGGLIVYTLTYTNIGPVPATGVVITETVPANATFNAGASTAGWSCTDSSPAGTPCTLGLGTLQVNVPGSVSFAVTVDDPLPPGVTEILNATSISDDHSQGPDPTPGNNTSQERTPVNRIVTPVLSKVSDRSQAMPGDVVNFTITASLATPPSNVNASNVIIVDALPKELELVNYSVSSLLPGLGYTSDVTTATISTAGHPSGIQQTTVATITVNVPVFSVNDRVTILVQARVNGLASPAPFNITNLAVLDYDEGDPRTSSVVVNVPPASSNPPKGGGGGGGGGDDDDDDTPSSPTTSASAAPAPAPGAQPTPGLPVLFLPETGQKGVTPAAKANGAGFGVIWLVVLGSGIAGYFWWQAGKTRRKS